MLKVTGTRLLQHLIAQNSWASEILRPYAGKTILLSIHPSQASLTILENGQLAIAGESYQADASITISPSLLFRLMAHDLTATSQIIISGDIALASTLGRVLRHLRWDYADDVSRVIGDVPAQHLEKSVKEIFHVIHSTTKQAADMMSEYWQEENPLIAKKRHVEQFNAAVDTLRNHADRLEKRIEKLTKRLSPTSK